MGDTTSDIPRVINCMQLPLCPRARRTLGYPRLHADRVLNSPKEKLSGRLAVTPVAQVEVKEYRVLARLILQLGNRLFGLGNIRGSDVNGRSVVQESLFDSVVKGDGWNGTEGMYLCRIPADFVVWIGDHNHLASEVW